MGFNKALLPVEGRPLIAAVADKARPIADEVITACNDPESYRFLGLATVADIFADQGPLSGLHAAMNHTDHKKYLILEG